MPLISQLNLIFCLRYTIEPDGATLAGGNDISVKQEKVSRTPNPY